MFCALTDEGVYAGVYVMWARNDNYEAWVMGYDDDERDTLCNNVCGWL